ncbi:STAS domain-containing protein [Formosa haliotis]|uniref:STAS domain-containing protein n=1 Tax=Formosa haliotis TaxID=1555194 RepID=UPI00082549CB|nr:STAS domain-containing protein [Formosa haliotis]
MELTITHYNNYFKIKGILTKHNLDVFYNYFQDVFDDRDRITINLSGLDVVDQFGVQALEQLQKEAKRLAIPLSIIGSGQTAIYDHFKTEALTSSS